MPSSGRDTWNGPRELRKIVRLAAVDSTNDEALRQLAAGAQLPLWIVADEQRSGRGRNGRPWHSPKGNLYASHLMTTAAPPAIAAQLSFVAALAAHDVIVELAGHDRAGSVKLKWPNDVILDGAKIAGILLECVTRPQTRSLAVVLGIGINLAHSPKDAARPVASLGLSMDPSTVLQAFCILHSRFSTWHKLWDDGREFTVIRGAWLDRAFALGTPITVNLNNGTIHGTFKGIAPGGALEIETQPGLLTTITAGDVSLDAPR